MSYFSVWNPKLIEEEGSKQHYIITSHLLCSPCIIKKVRYVYKTVEYIGLPQHLKWSCLCHFFISNTFVSNARLKVAKNQVTAKQHPEAELLLFENYSHSSCENNRTCSRK